MKLRDLTGVSSETGPGGFASAQLSFKFNKTSSATIVAAKMNNYRCIRNYRIVWKFNEVPRAMIEYGNTRLQRHENVGFGTRQQILENSFSEKKGAEKEGRGKK